MYIYLDATRYSEAVARFKMAVHAMNMYLSRRTNLKTITQHSLLLLYTYSGIASSL